MKEARTQCELMLSVIHKIL